jgi:hypothetical protein
MDFLSNLEKILVVLSPEIGESCHQKAEGGYHHPPFRAAAAFTSSTTFNTFSIICAFLLPIS